MGILSKDALLAASDLREEEVDLRPHIDGSVRVRSLPAAYSNQAVSEAMVMSTSTSGAQTARMDTVALEELQVFHGLVEPKFDTLEEVKRFSERCGPAWGKIAKRIQDISNIDQEAIERKATLFQAGGGQTPGVSAGDGAGPRSNGSDLSLPAGGDTAHAGR